MRRFGTRALPILVLFLTLVAGVGQGEVLLDFEQPYYLERDSVFVKDHAVVRHEGIYHVFFIQSLPQEFGEYERTERWLGHITSSDLRHWTAQDSILPVVPDTWEGKFIWAPRIIESPVGQGWWLYYTGADEDVCQQIGLAFSSDLYTWVRNPVNPVYKPGRWSDWELGEWSNCRDPEIYFDEGNSTYYMLSTATTNFNQGALGLATSLDALEWEDSGTPFLTNDDSLQIESTHMVQDESGLFHLFYHEEDSDGTYHQTSTSFLDGWDMANGTYVAKRRGVELTRIDDEWLFSGFNTVPMMDGPQSYLRFDNVDIDTADNEPDILSLQGLQEHWHKVFGTAFDFQPTWGDNSYERGSVKSRMEGNSYIATYERFPWPGYNVPGWIQGNGPVGMIKTDYFNIESDRFSMLVGGGAHPDTCFVAMVDANTHQLYFSQTGNNSDMMISHIWKTETLVGTQVYMVIADLYDGQWGSIAVDSIKEYMFNGHEPGTPIDPMVDGPTLWTVLENAGFGGTAIDNLPRPVSGKLLNPHPNPFNPTTHLSFVLDEPGILSMSIHDASGRKLRTLWDAYRERGEGALVWDGRDDAGRPLPSGLYFANMELGGRHVESRKLVLLK
ncbi:hypothetical protein H8E52_11165 [bacterium]|nr:hypothetical protein [bacterium]